MNDEMDRATELRDSVKGLIVELLRSGYRGNDCYSGHLSFRRRMTPALEECLRDVDRACLHWQAMRRSDTGATTGDEV